MPCLYLGPPLVDSWPCDYLCLLSLLCIVLGHPTQSVQLEISLGCVISNGVMSSNYGAAMKPMASYGLQPQGCAARHALVSRFLVMIHCRTTPMCYFHMSFSLIISPDPIRRSPYLIKRSLYRTKSSKASFQSCKKDNLEEQIIDININRLWEVVDKWLYLTVPIMTLVI